jgi:hypothetical protein
MTVAATAAGGRIYLCVICVNCVALQAFRSCIATHLDLCGLCGSVLVGVTCLNCYTSTRVLRVDTCIH